MGLLRGGAGRGYQAATRPKSDWGFCGAERAGDIRRAGDLRRRSQAAPPPESALGFCGAPGAGGVGPAMRRVFVPPAMRRMCAPRRRTGGGPEAREGRGIGKCSLLHCLLSVYIYPFFMVPSLNFRCHRESSGTTVANVSAVLDSMDEVFGPLQHPLLPDPRPGEANTAR